MSKEAVAPRSAAGKVLIIVENLPVPFDRRVWQEATALHGAGYEVSIICPKGKGHNESYEVLNGIRIYRHALPLEASGVLQYAVEYSFALFSEFFLSLRVWRRHGFDLIHACNPPDLIFLIALVYKLFFGKKFLFDQHDINPELYEVKFGRQGLVHFVLRLLERCTYRLADGSLATSEALKERAVASGLVPRDRVWVVRSFPDLDRFQRSLPDPILRRGHKYLVGYVGIMAEQDGVELLVRAMAHVVKVKGREDIGCIVIGDGPDFDRLRGLMAELGLGDHMQFAGYLSGDKLFSALSSCDIGVIPDPSNVCNDKLSMNKVFEYMALGLPFVQFDLPQAKADAGDASMIVGSPTPEALGDGMIELLGDADRREQMAAYAIARAHREFHWKVEKQTLLEAYGTLLPAASEKGTAALVDAPQQ
ncbi:glycosyltransferase family 4 protein [Mesorhizobium koreense]|uniref:glycosyltransferase family 4 protein n=1 Tax=Mesorhizobium koreense TaxID=3074855 RepID=UPI00287BA4A0|nr:glycosyltransferase family 4 protein [Mesorhizobium sp. WR6]